VPQFEFGSAACRGWLLHHRRAAIHHIEIKFLDVHIRRVRQAINLDGQPELIRTVRSAGHSLDDDAA